MNEITTRPHTPEHSQDGKYPQPFVSVIVPVRNAPRRIRLCIEALLQQDYPRQGYEIIIVDNGSSDGTRQVVATYPVTLLEETSFPSPYVARNTGIRQAQGEILAFTDANCIPAAQWLEQGTRALQEQAADLAGGKVTFLFSPEKSVGEMVDALFSVDIETSIAAGQASATGNLFVRRVVFDAIGLFPTGIRSGGDGIWTNRAARQGFKLIYAPAAEVSYPARSLRPLLQKMYRIGRGHPGAWAEQGWSPLRMARHIVRGFLPPGPGRIHRQICRRGTVDMLDRFLAIWLATWLRYAVRSLGQIDGLLRPPHNSPGRIERDSPEGQPHHE